MVKRALYKALLKTIQGSIGPVKGYIRLQRFMADNSQVAATVGGMNIARTNYVFIGINRKHLVLRGFIFIFAY